MKCPNCNKSASVVIGERHYCSACGERMSAPKAMSSLDMKPQRSTTQKSAPAPARPQPARRPISAVVAPVASQRLMRDVATTVRPQLVATEAPRSAGAFHAKLKPAAGGVLDLRAATPKAAPKTFGPKAPVRRHTAVAAKTMHTPEAAPIAAPATKATSLVSSAKATTGRRLTEAVAVPRSRAIARFHAPTQPTAAVTKAAVKPEASVATPELPAHVAAQHEHLNRLLDVMGTAKDGSHPQATKPSRGSFAVAAAAIAVMGGYIWLHNYPHLAMSTVSSKAGFSASLPGFIPTSYNLTGSPNYTPGLVTLNFTSPSFKDPLKVTQQPTAWDSNSLLDNYVASKTSDYASVSGQGLTIYLFNDNQQATWINHGVWYSVVGATHLSRDQLLKMAYSF